MASVALCMIVRDEESNLARCLRSVEGVFDQLVIVDTGSVDRTKEIARSFGAEIHDFKWVNDFAAARNYSFTKCRCDYVAWLDADDEILPDSKQRLIELKQHLQDADTWLMPYSYVQDECGNPLTVLYRHRILRYQAGVQWRWPIHECLQFPPHWSQRRSDVIVTHRRSMQDMVRDQGRNIKLLREAIIKDPTEPRIKFYYAKELFSENLLEECLTAFVDYYSCGGGWHDDQINGYYIMALAHWRLGREDKAIDCCMTAIRIDPRWAEFYVTVGQIYYNAEKWAQAIPWFELASRMPIPDVFGTVLRDNYTWVPHDRLCKCYSQLGRVLDAYQANEQALSYRPTDPRLLYNQEFLRDQLFQGRRADRPIRLSIGSGGKPTLSYRCTDLYPTPGTEELFDQCKIPYRTASVHALYSEHALEHSAGHQAAEAAISEWARVLRHGGQLTLKVPDLDQCCEKFVLAEDRARAPNERWTHKEWYRYTIYGIQQSQNGESDAGQYHRTGFTKAALQRLLEQNGFEIRGISNYDGYGTPSIQVTAVQTTQPIKVAWLIPGHPDEDHGSLRIRRLNVHRWLQGQQINSVIIDVNDPELLMKTSQADVCVFVSFGQVESNVIGELKRRGIKCVMDHCEDLEGLPHQTECYQAMDLIVCCSTVLAAKAHRYGRAVAIADAYEERA